MNQGLRRRILLMPSQTKYHSMCPMGCRYHWPETKQLFTPPWQRMDGAMLASIQIAEHKARAAATFRRPTKIFEDDIQLMHLNYLLAFDGVIASRGGIPLIHEGTHRFARATCRPRGDQGAHGARLPQAGRCRKSARILSEPNRAVGRRTTQIEGSR